MTYVLVLLTLWPDAALQVTTRTPASREQCELRAIYEVTMDSIPLFGRPLVLGAFCVKQLHK